MAESRDIWDALHGQLEGEDLEVLRHQYPSVGKYLDSGGNIVEDLSPREYDVMRKRYAGNPPSTVSPISQAVSDIRPPPAQLPAAP